MKKLFLLSLLSSCVYACEPNSEYPWPSLSKSCHNLPAYEEESFDDSEGSVISHDLSSSLFQVPDCNNEKIQDASYIKDSIELLCHHLELKKDGSVEVSALVDNEQFIGYSLSQFHTTGLIAGFFDIKKNKAYINIFCAKTYDTDKAKEFIQFCFKK